MAGPGANGAAGLVAAWQLHRAGRAVRVVVAGHPARGEHNGDRRRAGIAARERFADDLHMVAFDGTVPPADVYVDALVGGGLRTRLHGNPLDVLLALRVREAPIVAIDLPSGLHPTRGLVGDTLSATVTVALRGLWPALRMAGMSPFVGDLYLWDGDDRVVRLVGGPDRAAIDGGWRE
jgi:NAD(P)H-hydrate epimerase